MKERKFNTFALLNIIIVFFLKDNFIKQYFSPYSILCNTKNFNQKKILNKRQLIFQEQIPFKLMRDKDHYFVDFDSNYLGIEVVLDLVQDKLGQVGIGLVAYRWVDQDFR